MFQKSIYKNAFILFDISTLKFQAWKHLLDTLSKHPELQ